MALPHITITSGTLVADPEVRYTNNGKAVINFRIATNSRRKNQQTGEWEDADSTFLTCTAWEGLGENIATTFKKGAKIDLTGSLRQRDYEKDGQKRTVFEVTVDTAAVPVPRFADKSNTPPAGQTSPWDGQNSDPAPF